ncbi:ABC transporter substrate-binding protein [Shinella pollutisoli]|uniref:ABC transporter substrate-binding protein n=1 Tax=Shinella pollutisoli TaxID=2250594 RepID=A0ABV7DKY4_9HYPH|nr:ABC transporter substrate-binding protein [Shinella pollutisoli]
MKLWTFNRRDLMKSLALGVAGCLAGGNALANDNEVSFVDLAGTEHILDAPATRIVDLVVLSAFVIAAHGNPDRLIAVHPRNRDEFERGFLHRIFPRVLDIDTSIIVGSDFNPNVEAVANYAPDVVLQWGDMGNDLFRPLENAGLRVAKYQEVREGADETIERLLLMLGAMIGDTSRAERLITYRRSVDGRLRTRTDRLAPDERPSALILTVGGNSFYASGGGAEGTYSFYLYRAGGVNAAADLPNFAQVSAEQIAAMAPDCIFLFNVPGVSPSNILDHPILGLTPAALSSRVYLMPTGSHHWGSVGPEDPLTSLWMAELLHPGRSDWNLRNELAFAYRSMFGQAFSDDDLDEVLHVAVNRNSAEYERFLA